MTAVIDKIKEVETIGGVEAYMINHHNGTVDLYTSPEDKTTVDTKEHKVKLQRCGVLWAVIKDGMFIG